MNVASETYFSTCQWLLMTAHEWSVSSVSGDTAQPLCGSASFFLFLFSTLANLLGAVALSNENDTQSKIHSCFNYVEGRHFRTTLNLKKKNKNQCTNCFPDRKPSTNTPETSPVPTQPCTHLTIFLNHRSKSRRLFIIYLTRRINLSSFRTMLS